MNNRSESVLNRGYFNICVAIHGVKALISAYDGYEKGRFMKSDEAVRAEIQRRCEMVARHAEKLQGDVHQAGYRDARTSLESLIESTHILRNEAQFSITSNHVSKHKGIGKLKTKAVRKLVNHDSEVLQALVETTRDGQRTCTNDMNDLDEESVNSENFRLASKTHPYSKHVPRKKHVH